MLALACLSGPISAYAGSPAVSASDPYVQDTNALPPLASVLAQSGTPLSQYAQTGSQTATGAGATTPTVDTAMPALPGNDNGDAATSNMDSNLWSRIRQGFQLRNLSGPLVEANTRWYQQRPQYVTRMLDRARRYLYHVVQEVQKRGMPTEIALLPMVESAFNPQAYSNAHAAGLWQFIPSTARLYGLKESPWYDGRRDVIAGTDAALNYLQKLFLDFGSWDLALAAYNCGEGCVARAMQHNAARGLPTNYQNLPLPAETKNYVPKLMAMKQLIEDPEAFGVDLAPLPDSPYFTKISLDTGNIDVNTAARLAGMSTRDFLALNPAFPRKLIHAHNQVTVLVPVDKASEFQSNLEQGDWDRWEPYQARRGESLDAVAQKFNVDAQRLAEHNILRLYRGRFRVAQTILVPVKADDGGTSLADSRVAWEAVAQTLEGRGGADAGKRAPAAYWHTVRRGEDLIGLARKNGVSVAQIKQWNHLRSNGLRIGQKLVFYRSGDVRRSAYVPARARRHVLLRHYTVRRGDTLSGIAQRFEVSLADLRAWNHLGRSELRAGQRLVVHAG